MPPSENWVINRLHESEVSCQKRSLKCDIQESTARMDTQVRWGKKIEGSDGAFFRFRGELTERVFGYLKNREAASVH